MIEANGRALQHLSNMQLVFSEYEREPWKGKVGRITKEYDACIRAVEDMAKNFFKLRPDQTGACDDKCCKPIKWMRSKIQEADSHGTESVLKLESIIDGVMNPDAKEEALKSLYIHVEKLNLTEEKVDISDVSSVHDCIRYLHQSAIEYLFEDYHDLLLTDFTVYKKRIGDRNNCSFRVIDLSDGKLDLEKVFGFLQKEKLGENRPAPTITNTLEENLALRAVYEGYAKNDKKVVCRSHEINMLADENSISVQIKLGCHYLKMESKISDRDSFVSLNYMDTQNRSSKNRLGYMKQILIKLGYQVEIKGQNLKAGLYHKSPNHTYGALEETARLLISSNNLDIIDAIKKRTNEAVYRFLNGETDIELALQKHNKMNPKKCKAFISKYNYAFDAEDENGKEKQISLGESR